MTTIGQAAAAIGIVAEPGRDHCVCIIRDGKPVNRTLRHCADHILAGDTYLASGTFRLGTLRSNKGRSEENLDSVYWLPLDADLSDFLGMEREELHTWSDTELDKVVEGQRRYLEDVLTLAGIPVHRIDATGYGLCAYIVVAEADRGEVKRLRTAHKAIVARINHMAKAKVVDPQVSDAGTRITRLPPAPNMKGGRSRPSATLVNGGPTATLAEIEAMARSTQPGPPARVIPEHGVGLTSTDEDALVAALKAHWLHGNRHALALALSGMLAKGGVPQEQATRIVAALSAGDDEGGDRLRAVQTSYDRVRAGFETRGFQGLREMLPPDLVSWIDGLIPQRRSGARLIAGTTKERALVPTAPTPEACMRGPIGDYVRLASPTTEASDALLLGGWLSILAATVGRRVSISYARDLYPNLFVCLVGDTGFSRKDHAIDLALDTAAHEARSRSVGPGARLRQTSPDFGISSDISSAQGLVKNLDEANGELLVRLRELTTLLDNMRRQSTTTIADKCIELWDSPPETANNTKKDGLVVLAPCLNIVAPTQPERLARKMSEEDVASGFANRWLYLFGGDKDPMPEPPRFDVAAAAEMYQRFRENVERFNGRTLPLADETRERWNNWYLTTMAEAKAEPVSGAMRIRHHPMARKVALLYAIADGAESVSLDHLNAGIGLVDWSWAILRDQVRGWGAGDEVRMERRIEEVLREKGAMRKRMLQALCKRASWPQTMFHRVVEAMLRNGTIGWTDDERLALAGVGEEQ